MSFLNSLNIAGSALTAERFRMEMITQNLSNATVSSRGADGQPYRRKQVIFEEREINFKRALQDEQKRLTQGGVRVKEVVESQRDFNPIYDPTHPDANEDGYVMYPNVNTAEEIMDMMASTRAYEANLTALNLVKSMASKALEIGK